jgi:hypothetical protein
MSTLRLVLSFFYLVHITVSRLDGD